MTSSSEQTPGTTSLSPTAAEKTSMFLKSCFDNVEDAQTAVKEEKRNEIHKMTEELEQQKLSKRGKLRNETYQNHRFGCKSVQRLPFQPDVKF